MNGKRELPIVDELSLAEAAKALDLDRRTVKKLIEQGVLRARLASPPGSLRPRYRLPAEEVIAYRNTYRTFQSPRASDGKQAAPQRRVGELLHIRLRKPNS
jgi:excisionase family DNA binding protein